MREEKRVYTVIAPAENRGAPENRELFALFAPFREDAVSLSFSKDLSFNIRAGFEFLQRSILQYKSGVEMIESCSDRNAFRRR